MFMIFISMQSNAAVSISHLPAQLALYWEMHLHRRDQMCAASTLENPVEISTRPMERILWPERSGISQQCAGKKGYSHAVVECGKKSSPNHRSRVIRIHPRGWWWRCHIVLVGCSAFQGHIQGHIESFPTNTHTESMLQLPGRA